MSEPTKVPVTPNEELAGLVVKQLILQGLLPEGKKAEIVKKMASGRASQDDWKLWCELPQIEEEAQK